MHKCAYMSTLCIRTLVACPLRSTGITPSFSVCSCRSCEVLRYRGDPQWSQCGGRGRLFVARGDHESSASALPCECQRHRRERKCVNKTAFGIVVPWRDASSFGPGFQFSADGHLRGPGEEDPRAQLRTISPGFFAALGAPIIAGRDFNALDGQSKEPVVIVSQTLAQRMFPNQDAVNRHVFWTDPVMKFIPGINTAPHRIIGVTADIDDERVVPGPILMVYNPFEEGPMFGGRLFIHTSANPYSLVTPITRLIREMS